MVLVTKPFTDDLKCVDFWIVPARKREVPRNVLVCLIKSGDSTGVYPEYPALWIFISESVTVLDGYLGFPVQGVH